MKLPESHQNHLKPEDGSSTEQIVEPNARSGMPATERTSASSVAEPKEIPR
jgi:hypothetical protein